MKEKEKDKCALCGGKVGYGPLGLWDDYKSELDGIGGVLHVGGVLAVYKDSRESIPLCPACILRELQSMARYGLARLAADEDRNANRFRCMECGRVFTLPKTRKTAEYCSETCKRKVVAMRRKAKESRNAEKN